MSTLFILLTSVQVIFCILMILIVLKQSKKASGITGGNLGGMGENKTYWDRNKARSLEGQLEKWTMGLAIVLFITTILLNFVK